MTNLVIGYGEIGRAVGAIIGTHDFIDKDFPVVEGDFDVIHICFPYSDTFLSDVNYYYTEYGANHSSHIIIWSTLPIGTTKYVGQGAVHSPVEGKHPDLELSIRYMERWIGYNDKEEGLFFNGYFRDLGLRTRMVENSDCTEALKLLSTTEYGINIEFARYKKHIADEIGMDYQLCKDFNTEYNKLYKNLGLDNKYQRYVLDAPEGPKGGHCVTPNARLLDSQFPNAMVQIVSET